MVWNEKVAVDARIIGHSEPCFLVAEAGVNHNGNFHLAKKLVESAANAGADAIKFQTFEAESLVNRSLSGNQFDMLRRLEIDSKDLLELKDYAKSFHLTFFSTPFDENSVDILANDVKVSLFKVGSGDLNNLPLLRKISQTGKPMIVSTGMSTIPEICEALDAIRPCCDNVILTHCTSLYPADFNEINLRAMSTLRQVFSIPVGYSDHSLGTEVSLAAVVLGACVIEKHLTLDKGLEGPDHKTSLDAIEFERMVKQIRNIENALGATEKRPFPREQHMRSYARRSITAMRDIPKNKTIIQADLGILRPGTGIEPKYLEEIVGKKTKASISRGEQISWEMLE